MNATRTRRTHLRLLSLALTLFLAFGSFAGIFESVLPFFTAEAATYTAENYYSSLNTSKKGAAFRSELAALITKTHTKSVSYRDLEWVFETSDVDPNNPGHVIWFYTGTSAKYNGFGSGNGSTNREHVWPKNGGSAFPETNGPGSDAHHLRPTEAQLNSTRGSLSFGEVAQTAGNIVKQNGRTDYGSSADKLCYKSGSFFYPAEGYRGATARILMYMQVRWGDTYGLYFVEGAGSNKSIGDIKTLMKWHLEEPPTEEEIRRNEAVFAIQGNRNPFIDHPEYAEQIFCYDGKSYNSTLLEVVEQYGGYNGGGGSTDTPTVTLPMSSLTLNVGESRTLIPTVTPSDFDTDYIWVCEDTSVLTVENGVLTAQKSGSTRVTVYLTANQSVSASVTVTVKAISGISVAGTPVNTVYTAGSKFNPTGLTVTLHFTDGSSERLQNSACRWLDPTTRQEVLLKGSTQVICCYGEFEAVVSGIEVGAPAGGSFTVSRDSFTGSGAYAWVPWACGDFEGFGYIYSGNKTEIQMNDSQTSYYIYNTTPATGGVLSITVKDSRDSNRNVEIRTSQTPFTQVKGAPTTGTSHGTKTVGREGTTWIINTTDQYFAICYADSKAFYLSSIEVVYSGACSHEATTVKTTQPTFSQTGSITKTCSACGEEWRETLPVLNADDYQVSDDGMTFTYLWNGVEYKFNPLRFYAASVYVDEAYRLSFYIPVEVFEQMGVTSYTVLLESVSGVRKIYTNSYSKITDDRYVFTLPSINPDKMVDTVTATLTATVGGNTYTSVKEYSVKAYCYDRLHQITDAEERRLLVDLLNYASAAQDYTGYQTDRLANADLTAEEQAYATADPYDFEIICDKNYVVNPNADVEWMSAGMVLTDCIGLYFTVDAENVDGLHVEITMHGKTTTVDTFVKQADGTYRFDMKNIGLFDLDTVIELTVYDGDTAVSNTLRYSAASYAMKAYAETADTRLGELLYALMCLGSR